MQDIIIEDKTVDTPKEKRKYTRRGSARPEVPAPAPAEEIPELELTPMEEPKPEPPAVNPSLTSIRAATEKELRRHAEMDYITGIIDTLALKHSHRYGLTMQEVKDDIIVRIIRNVHA